MVTRFGVKNVFRVAGCLITAGLLLAVILPQFLRRRWAFAHRFRRFICRAAGIRPGREKQNNARGYGDRSGIDRGIHRFLFGPPLIGYIAQAFDLRWSFAIMAALGFGTTLMAGRATRLVAGAV